MEKETAKAIARYGDKIRGKPSPYQRIMRAGREGKGIRLSAKEVAQLVMDEAVNTVARNDDFFDETGEEYRE